MKLPKVKIGFLPANRGFFSVKLASEMRGRTVAALRKAGVAVVAPSPAQTRAGCVESLEEAVIAGRLFREDRVDGILISAVNFGDEQAAALAVRESGLRVPILIVGCQEQEVLTPATPRRDSFCGLLSIAEALRQIGASYSVPETPICRPEDEGFAQTLARFAAVCRVVGGLRTARYGQVGARPDAFWTCRFSEKALQQQGPTVVTLDLSEVIGQVAAMKTDAAVRRTVADMKRKLDCSAIPEPSLERIAKLERVLRKFVADRRLDALAIQCWTSLQQNLGVCACTTMSRLNDEGVPCACESDILGAMSMHALHLAGGGPSALADWNNVHNEDPELINCWHCGAFPASWAQGQAKMGCQEIIAGTTGRDNAMGVVEFVMENGPVTLCRLTQDGEGRHLAVLAEGAVETTNARTFGSYGWVRIPGIQRLYKDVLLRRFPHHVGLTRGRVGNVLWEALGNYMGLPVFTAKNTAAAPWTPEMPFDG